MNCAFREKGPGERPPCCRERLEFRETENSSSSIHGWDTRRVGTDFSWDEGTQMTISRTAWVVGATALGTIAGGIVAAKLLDDSSTPLRAGAVALGGAAGLGAGLLVHNAGVAKALALTSIIGGAALLSGCTEDGGVDWVDVAVGTVEVGVDVADDMREMDHHQRIAGENRAMAIYNKSTNDDYPILDITTRAARLPAKWDPASIAKDETRRAEVNRDGDVVIYSIKTSLVAADYNKNGHVTIEELRDAGPPTELVEKIYEDDLDHL